MSPAWVPTLRMALHPHCLESSVPVGLETTAQAPIVCLATQAAGQWGAAGGAAVEGREPREEMSWDHPTCWAAITGHQGHGHCQVSGGAKETRAAWKGLWDGEEAQHLPVQRLAQRKVHIHWKVPKVDQLYPKYHLPLHIPFPQPTQIQVFNSLMGWGQGITFPEQKLALWLCSFEH